MVRSQSQAPGVAVAPSSARAPPPPWSRSWSRRPSPALEAVGLGQTDFLLFWETEGCGAAGCGLRAAGELAGGERTSLPRRIPTTLPRAGRDSGRPGAERGGRAPRRCGVAAAARSARQHRSLGGEQRGVGGWQRVPRWPCTPCTLSRTGHSGPLPPEGREVLRPNQVLATLLVHGMPATGDSATPATCPRGAISTWLPPRQLFLVNSYAEGVCLRVATVGG